MLQMTYLVEQAVLLESNNDPKSAEIRKRILKAEELTRMFKKLWSYLWPNQHNNLTHVVVPTDGLPPKESQHWTHMSDPEEVETSILDRNRLHFGQGHGTPFTQGELGHIPFSATRVQADAILEGSSCSSDRVTQLVLGELRKPPGIHEISNNFTMEEFIGKLANWKESTSTSPITKRHLGHYKCLL